MLAKDDQARSGGTTRFTVWRTSNPFDEALTTSADAGVAASSTASAARYFMAPPQSRRMPGSGRAVQNRVDLGRDRFDRRHAVDAADEPALLVIRQDRLGLGAIF